MSLDEPGKAGEQVEVTYLEAITAALRDALEDDDRVFLLGEDIGHFGGAFGVTKGLLEVFGEDRVIDTPIAEEGFVGAAIGAAWMGERPVVELQFADFVACAFDPIVTVAAKTHWRSGQQIPLVVRMPSGGGIRGGPFHAGSPEGWFVGEPGLKVVCPATVEDAYGLTRAAIDDPDPVLVFEHKALYRRLTGPLPPRGHRTPIGRAWVARAGADATVVTYGSGLEVALGAVAQLGVDVEIVDLRTVWPFDEAAVLELRPAYLTPAGRAGGTTLRGGREPRPRARRAARIRGSRRAAGGARAPRHTGAVRPRARGRIPPRRRHHRACARGAPCLLIPAATSPPSRARSGSQLHRLVLLQRLFEERALALYRQGRIPGSFYDGRGQEAVAAGAGLALGDDDVVCPLNRELAVHLARGATTADVFRNFLGRGDSPTRGRDGNMHFGAPHRGVFPLVSMLGDLVPVTVGAALAFKRRGAARVALTFLGEGALSVGDTHEGFNLAGLWRVPAVFVIQRNHYSYSTPIERQMVNTQIDERVFGGWSIPCDSVDGTDAVTTFDAVRAAVERARSGQGPQAVEAVTLRIHGHAAHDDGRYVARELRAAFAARDPVERIELRLTLDGITRDELERLRAGVANEVAAGLAAAEASPPPDGAMLEDGVWAAPPG